MDTIMRHKKTRMLLLKDIESQHHSLIMFCLAIFPIVGFPSQEICKQASPQHPTPASRPVALGDSMSLLSSL